MAIVFNPFLARGGGTMNIGISEMDSDLWAYLNGESTVLSSYDIQRIDCGMPQHTTEINLPNCNYVTEFAFTLCENLQNICFSSDVRVGRNAFASAFTSSAEISLNAYSIEEYAFYGANLAVLDLSCAQAISRAFNVCQNLSMVTVVAPMLGKSAFADCSNLQTVYCTCERMDSTTFYNDPALTSIYLYNSRVTELDGDAYGIYYSGIIYVPSELYDSYITAVGWNQMSSRIQSIPSKEDK